MWVVNSDMTGRSRVLPPRPCHHTRSTFKKPWAANSKWSNQPNYSKLNTNTILGREGKKKKVKKVQDPEMSAHNAAGRRQQGVWLCLLQWNSRESPLTNWWFNSDRAPAPILKLQGDITTACSKDRRDRARNWGAQVNSLPPSHGIHGITCILQPCN